MASPFTFIHLPISARRVLCSSQPVPSAPDPIVQQKVAPLHNDVNKAVNGLPGDSELGSGRPMPFPAGR